MTNEYRIHELANATAQWKAARELYDNAKTVAVRREAAEDVEFWGNKMAFLSNAR